MPRYLTALFTVLALAAPTNAQALELGIQDAVAPIEQRNHWASHINAKWERFAVYVGQPGVAAKIRESHAAGRKVILTVGGLGTRTRRPSFTKALRYIRSLPRAERYTISNEPDLDGVKACSYRKGWMKARRSLGRKLLWGDTVSGTVTFTLAAAKCGRLPHRLAVAVHPYQWTGNPLYPTTTPKSETNEAALGNLPRARQALARAGIRVEWWLTEFGYAAHKSVEHGFEMDGVQDHEAAVLWPQALKQARRVKAKVLVLYTASGPSWDTRPGVLAWAAIRSTV